MTTETIFRKVSVKERLPNTLGEYYETNDGKQLLTESGKFKWSTDYWFEPIPLSTLIEHLEGEMAELKREQKTCTCGKGIINGTMLCPIHNSENNYKHCHSYAIIEVGLNEKDKQIQELKEECIDVLMNMKGSFPFHDGSLTEGESTAIYKCNSFLSKYKDSKKQ